MSEKRWVQYLPWLLAVLLLAVPQLVTNIYYMHVINLAGLYMIVAIGLNILAGYTGQLSIGHAGFFAIGAYTVGLLNVRAQVPILLALPLAGLVAGLFGVLVGLPTLKLKGPYLVMATVGFGEIVRILLVEWSDLTRGTAGLINIGQPGIGAWRLTSDFSFFYAIFGLLAFVILLTRRLVSSKVGRAWMAIRERETAAEVMGISTVRYKIAAFAVSAMWTGVAGGLFASFQGYISPDSFSFEDSVSFVSMIVVGGIGHLWGGIIGAGILTVAAELLRAFKDYRLIIFGAILIASVLVFPLGLAPLLESLWQKVTGKGGASWGKSSSPYGGWKNPFRGSGQ